MKTSPARFLYLIFAITLICALLQLLWNHEAPENFRIKTAFLILAVFSSSLSAVYVFLLKSLNAAPQSFVLKYMSSVVFKFLFYILLVVLLLLFSGDNKPALVVHFMIYYLIFTILEVVSLYRTMRKRNSS